ncbi:SDR family oxidoreductase [Umezawaea sp. Da 62-37]|uniref:SDR family NAD(P)-dependent oxidoreductase n=1 Tax=Umezawaea sp. Da 62-37 TaxID=3075927 RepID=UPI0028F746A8|nr:SDR family oxidoreductase [Umezawaea sp. Da 62-37]WNV86535.1 SDR family oxidoreductase [Umezawaea sp. Da 62-37]
MKTFQGTAALVTGASKGLGTAYAAELARRGAHLVLVARSRDALEDLAARLREAHGVRVEVITADLGDPAGPAHVVAELGERGIEVDLLLNNAGLGSVGPFLDRPLEQHLVSVDVNIGGLVALTQLLGGRMLARGRGGIVNIASTAAFQPMPYQASYAATKAFVLSFSEALAAELRGSGVTVMAAHPGAVATGFFDGTTATIDPRRADTPERVAARTLDDFARGRHVSYPGRAVNRVGTLVSRLLPRRATTALVGRLNRGLGLDRVADVETPAT